MGWDREKEFQELLDKSAKKASKGGIEQLASIAVQDEKQCYKHVCALIERQMKRSKAKLRLNLLYVLSAICRQSRSQLKSKDKYVPRIEPQLVTIATLLAEGPLEQKESVSKVLRTWKKEEVFSVSVLREVEAVLGGQTEAMSSHIASPSLALPAGSSSPMNATASIERQSTGFALSDPSSGSQPPAAAPPPPPLSAPPNKFIKLTQFSGAKAPLSLSTGSSKPATSNEQYDPFAADSYAASSAREAQQAGPLPLPPPLRMSQQDAAGKSAGVPDGPSQASRKRSRWGGPMNTGDSTAVRGGWGASSADSHAGPGMRQPAMGAGAKAGPAPNAAGATSAAPKPPMAPKPARLTWGAGLASQGKVLQRSGSLEGQGQGLAFGGGQHPAIQARLPQQQHQQQGDSNRQPPNVALKQPVRVAGEPDFSALMQQVQQAAAQAALQAPAGDTWQQAALPSPPPAQPPAHPASALPAPPPPPHLGLLPELAASANQQQQHLHQKAQQALQALHRGPRPHLPVQAPSPATPSGLYIGQPRRFPPADNLQPPAAHQAFNLGLHPAAPEAAEPFYAATQSGIAQPHPPPQQAWQQQQQQPNMQPGPWQQQQQLQQLQHQALAHLYGAHMQGPPALHGIAPPRPPPMPAVGKQAGIHHASEPPFRQGPMLPAAHSSQTITDITMDVSPQRDSPAAPEQMESRRGAGSGSAAASADAQPASQSAGGAELGVPRSSGGGSAPATELDDDAMDLQQADGELPSPPAAEAPVGMDNAASKLEAQAGASEAAPPPPPAPSHPSDLHGTSASQPTATDSEAAPQTDVLGSHATALSGMPGAEAAPQPESVAAPSSISGPGSEPRLQDTPAPPIGASTPHAASPSRSTPVLSPALLIGGGTQHAASPSRSASNGAAVGQELAAPAMASSGPAPASSSAMLANNPDESAECNAANTTQPEVAARLSNGPIAPSTGPAATPLSIAPRAKAPHNKQHSVSTDPWPLAQRAHTSQASPTKLSNGHATTLLEPGQPLEAGQQAHSSAPDVLQPLGSSPPQHSPQLKANGAPHIAPAIQAVQVPVAGPSPALSSMTGPAPAANGHVADNAPPLQAGLHPGPGSSPVPPAGSLPAKAHSSAMALGASLPLNGLPAAAVRAAPAAVDHEAEESRFMGSRSSGRYMGSALLGIDDDFMDLSDPEDVAALFSI